MSFMINCERKDCPPYAISSFIQPFLILTLCFSTTGILIKEEWHPGRILPLNFGHLNASRTQNELHLHHRRLLGEARMDLFGHVLTKGYYYTNLFIGSPPQKFALIVDTGSTMTYVPCASCTSCGDHQDKPYSPSSSSTFQSISCQTEDCREQLCSSENACVYFRTYAEKSSSSGMLVSDIVSFSQSSTVQNQRLSFGCETMETGNLYTQSADGIIGLGRGKVGIIDQLVEKDAIDDVFSLCYGGMEYGGGSMILGEHPFPKDMVFASFDPSASDGFYNLHINTFRVDGKTLSLPDKIFDNGYGTVLDSGTTFSYLPKIAFDAFYKALKEGMSEKLKKVQGPDPKILNDICYSGVSSKFSELKNYFPKVEIVFSVNATYELDPENYLFKHSKISGAYCLGFFPAVDAGTLLGGIIVRNTLVTYDRRKKKIGFWKTNCKNLFSLLPLDKEFEYSNTSNSNTEPNSEFNPEPDSNALPPSNSPIGNSTNNSVFSPTCKGCASFIIAEMTLSIPFDQFDPFKNEFINDVSREISVNLKQVKIKDIDSIDSGIWLKIKVIPFYPDNFIPSDTVNNVVTAFSTNQLVLRDAFGDYNVTFYKVFPFHSNKKSSFRLWWVIVLCVSFFITTFLTLLFIFLWKIKTQKSNMQSQLHYGNMQSQGSDFSEEEYPFGRRNSP